MLYDIKLRGEFDGQVSHFQPVLAPLPIESTSVEMGKSLNEFILLLHHQKFNYSV